MSPAATPPVDVRRLVAAEEPHDGDPDGTAGEMSRLCRAARGVLEVSGVGVVVTTDEGPTTLLAATDAVTRQVTELQFALGEGPSWEAHLSRRPALAPDLGNGTARRWPTLVPAVRDLGIAALFAFPLQVGQARVGCLDLCRVGPGVLSRAEMALALDFADLATVSLLDGQQRTSRGATPDGFDRALRHRARLHQAQGMVVIQLDVDLGEAMSRIRAYAYSTERSLDEVAGDIVTRRLLLEEDVR